MKKQVILSTIIAMAALFAVTAASAGAGRGKGQRMDGERGERGDRMAQQLNLTAEQQTKLAELKQEMKTESKAIHAKIKVLKDKMKVLWAAKELNEEKIISLQKKIHALKGEQALLRTEFKIDMMQILDDAQKEIFRANMLKKMEHRGNGEHKGKRGHGPGARQCIDRNAE